VSAIEAVYSISENSTSPTSSMLAIDAYDENFVQINLNFSAVAETVIDETASAV
jgi:hypothetical protein